MPNLGSVTNYFATPNEGFSTTLGSTISSGAATVPLSGTAGLTNGSVFVGIIEPGAATQQVFTGTVDVAGSQITGVVWTRGSNTSHLGGVTIVDYVTGTAFGMATTGILKQHNQDGTHKSITSTNATLTNLTVTNLTVAGTNTTAGWNPLGQVPNTVVYNGNHSYTETYNGVDLTGTVTPGMRIQNTRTVAAPTKCTSLNGTTQYYSKTTPAGMTFTNNFVVSAWVKLSSYANAGIASRYNGTSGWRFNLDGSGRLELVGYNAGAANFAQSISYQSIPLNKWVHVAAQLDMTVTTTGTTNNYMTIDGVEVPNTVNRGGTNPTALIQAGNLEIGSINGGTSPFPGKIAQVAIYSAKVTQANVLATISQGLAGTETSLISAYSFNNSINDLNANANNLTANGSAVATNTDSPFGGQAGGSISSTLDYGIVTSASFSTNTTLVVQVPEGCTIPTSGGVSAVSYSTVAAPYGFPRQTGKWQVSLIILNTGVTTSGTSINTTYNPGGINLNVPIGEWNLRPELQLFISTNAAIQDVYSSLSTSSTVIPTGSPFTKRQFIGISGTNTFLWSTVNSDKVSLAAATPYYVLLRSTAAFTSLAVRGDTTSAVGESSQIIAECSYL